jgi:exodeoxyribonuclease-5
MSSDLGAVEMTGQQEQAVDKVNDWYHNSSGGQVFRLFGYAGTGKTTLARIIVEQLGIRGRGGNYEEYDEESGRWIERPGVPPVLYAAYTGKAAYVLRTKGATGAGTVHSLIYTPVEKARTQLDELRKQFETETDSDQQAILRKKIHLEEIKLAQPGFVLKEDSDLEHASLLVLDEVSMIGEKMAHDLLSFGTRLLVLGDPAQLPPVDGGGYFINHAPNYLLTEIHRSALDSPVTRIATAIRQSPPEDRTLGVSGIDTDSGRWPRLTEDLLLEFDQILVGTNKLRWNLIHKIRALYGLTGPVPLEGDRIIVLANNPEAAVFNGQMFTVAACRPSDTQPDVLHMLVFDDDTQPRMLNVWACGFENLDGEKLAKRNGRSRIVAATFGQAITVHKAQGSQWDNVLVVDESGTFAHIARKENQALGPAAADIEAHITARRWLYTAATRAAERVVIVPRGH